MLKKILIVEDDIDHIKRLSNYLRQYDLLLTRFYNEALDIAEAEKPDLIITDWELQSEAGDGISLIRTIKNQESTRHIPIIMATAFTSSDKLEQAFEAGAIDYLRKPFSEKELNSRVKSTLLVSSVPSKQAAAAKKVKVLLLGANPRGMESLDIYREFKQIKENLERIGKNRENFEVKIEPYVTKDVLLQILLDERPNILHFSGHGEDGVIFLHDENNFPLPLENFHQIINIFSEKYPFDCIVLNSCHSISVVENIKKVPVIGINGAIVDSLSIDFSTGFYKTLASGQDLFFAYLVGLAAANTNEQEIILKNY